MINVTNVPQLNLKQETTTVDQVQKTEGFGDENVY